MAPGFQSQRAEGREVKVILEAKGFEIEVSSPEEAAMMLILTDRLALIPEGWELRFRYGPRLPVKGGQNAKGIEDLGLDRARCPGAGFPFASYGCRSGQLGQESGHA
jgi:hypothetical protein